MTADSALPFILDGACVQPRRLPLVPEIELLLLADDYPGQSLAAADYHRLMAQPPYWAFCWGGGQALARWILDAPLRVQGRDVIDFGAGSGVAGIAAALAGAARVQAVDIDPDALYACKANAARNRVTLETSTVFAADRAPLLLAADIGYEESGFDAVIAHVDAGGAAIIAESRQRDLHRRFPRLLCAACFQVRTFPDLHEADCFNNVQIFTTLTD